MFDEDLNWGGGGGEGEGGGLHTSVVNDYKKVNYYHSLFNSHSLNSLQD